MAVYSQYNPATGQFEYFQGAPAAPQSDGDPASWNYAYWGQADPRAYPDYWARPDGSLLAQAMQAGLGWTAPRQELPYYGPQLPIVRPGAFVGGAGAGGGGGFYGPVGPSMYDRAASAASAAGQWFVDTGRRAAEAQDAAEDWIAGIR